MLFTRAWYGALSLVVVLAAFTVVWTTPAMAGGPEASAASSGEPYRLTGFRSARFGMTEQEVRDSLRADFPDALGTLVERTHPSERTRLLALTLPELVEQAGPVMVTYVFGYRSRQLIQVNLVWGEAAVSDSHASLDQLKAAAASLVRYFARYRYSEGTVTLNQKHKDGSVQLFKAVLEEGGSVGLRLGGVPQSWLGTAPSASQSELAYYLRLTYRLNDRNPDIYALEKGAF